MDSNFTGVIVTKKFDKASDGSVLWYVLLRELVYGKQVANICLTPISEKDADELICTLTGRTVDVVKGD